MKPEYNLYEWSIHSCIYKKEKLSYLVGVSNQYERGRHIQSSQLISIDFKTGVAETLNTIYHLKDGCYKD